MKTREEFTAACQALRKNDPCQTRLNLVEYGSLLVDRERVQQVTEALKKNTFVEDVTLSTNLCVHSTLQLNHILETSPSLRRLEMQGNVQGTDEEELKHAIKASIILESISRSSLLVKLTLREVHLEDDCPLEDFLSSTRTLLEFSYIIHSNSTMTYQVAQAIGSGLEQNKSLVKLSWSSTRQEDDFLEEILFGLCDHISLKTLDLEIRLTKSSSQALRSLLRFNGTLETLSLKQFEDQENFPTMVSVLAGLAQNKGLKKVTFGTDLGKSNATLATAWTSMLQRNTSITMLDLSNLDRIERELCSAVAEGLIANSTLETLLIPGWSNSDPEVFYGPVWVWQEMLESNHCLKKLLFTDYCSISLEGAESLARGLSRNTSLESLDLGWSEMADDSVVSLVDGLRTNKTLKCLNLSGNSVLSQSGQAAIERLIGYNVLKELILAGTEESVGASILVSGLSDNHSLERLDLDRAFVDGEGPETFRALCESLRGNTTLRYLKVSNNGVRLDGVCVTALKLDTMSLQILDLDFNSFTSCGIAALAQSLQGPCTLKKLSLRDCDLDDTGLLQLGEALTSNISLEDLDVRENDITHNGACQFFELLPPMKGLREVYGLMIIGDGVPPTEAVGMALLDGLRENTKLHEIIADDDEATIESYFSPGVAREIDFYLSLNSHGRMLLRPPGGAEPPSGLWSRVLAKITGPRDMSLLFYFLQNKPKLVDWNAPANRERKASDSPSLE
jgi:hypothetical protein